MQIKTRSTKVGGQIICRPGHFFQPLDPQPCWQASADQCVAEEKCAVHVVRVVQRLLSLCRKKYHTRVSYSPTAW